MAAVELQLDAFVYRYSWASAHDSHDLYGIFVEDSNLPEQNHPRALLSIYGSLGTRVS